MHVIIIDVERMVDLTKEKKMGVKGMVEVKNAYEKNGCWTNGRFDQRKKLDVEVCNKEKEKKMCMKWMVEVKNK